jgi:alkylation response protein AidB-like acyl-CoA dehydrogenase
VLGEIGQGHKIAFNILNIGRFKLGAGSLGAAKDCLQIALDYARERHQHGRAIASFGMIQRKLADMATRVYVADSMSYRTAGLMDEAAAAVDHGAPDAARRLVTEAIEEYTIECSILKVFGTETLDFVADEALQVLGGYGFTADYPVERHYRDSRINRIFEGTNEINRLIIPATLVKRIGKGRLPYVEFLDQVAREIGDRTAWPAAWEGPLAREFRAAEVAKRVIAYTARLLIERSLDSLKDKQQHLEILANMIIDAYAMDSVVGRTRLLRGHGTGEDDELRLAMANVFVSSANERVIDGARRILVNEFEGEELRKHLALESIVPHMPIRTIAVKTRISEALVARGLGPVFLR